MLIKNLAPLCGKNKAKLRDIFSKIGLNEKVRAQELSVEQWRQLVEVIHTYFFLKMYYTKGSISQGI